MRKYYLDNIRWITVVLVMIYHVMYMYNAEGILGGAGQITHLSVQYYDLYMYIVYPWFMPILFIVSGISAKLYLERHSDREFIRSRTAKLLVPSTIGLFVFQFIQGYVSMRLSGAFDTMTSVPKPVTYIIMALSGIGVLWYIQLLWVLSVLLVVVRKVEKGRLLDIGRKTSLPVLILMTLLIWGSAQVLNTPVVVVYRFGLYGLMFFLGYFIFSHDTVIKILKQYFGAFFVASAALCTAFCICFFGQNFADAPVNRSLLYTSYCWFACLAILGGAARYADKEYRLTGWMRKHSFGLYVFHYLGISAIALFVAKRGLLPPLLVYGISLVTGFAAGFVLNAVISRIPFFRWAVLGIENTREKRKANV